MCIEAVITGSCLTSYVTNHGTCCAMITYLVDACHSDWSIILLTVHFIVSTLTRYHNLCSSESFRQQIIILDGQFNAKSIPATVKCKAFTSPELHDNRSTTKSVPTAVSGKFLPPAPTESADVEQTVCVVFNQPPSDSVNRIDCYSTLTAAVRPLMAGSQLVAVRLT